MNCNASLSDFTRYNKLVFLLLKKNLNKIPIKCILWFQIKKDVIINLKKVISWMQDDKLDGPCKMYNDDNSLLLETCNKFGKYHGQCKFYLPEVTCIYNYENGVKEGDCRIYRNGELYEYKYYVNGKEYQF